MNWTNGASYADLPVLGRFSQAEVAQIDAAVQTYHAVSQTLFVTLVYAFDLSVSRITT